LVAVKEVYFLNSGTKELPRIARAEIAPDQCALVFTDSGRVEDFLAERPEMRPNPGNELPVVVSPTTAALTWCVENGLGVVINPGVGETAVISPQALAAFAEEWKQRGGRQAAGFWIPNMTTEEEDFWQENGL
jgi:hypothetical protein